MTDTTTLIQRLRHFCGDMDLADTYGDAMVEAADALEQQAAQIAEGDEEIARVTAELEALKGDLDPLFKDLADYGEENEALRADAERLRIGHTRYETVRLLSVQQFQDAYVLNRRTGKPFDEIIDDLLPFMRPHYAAIDAAPSVAPEPPEAVLNAAKEFVANGYRGPLNYAKLVFDYVAALPTAHPPRAPLTETELKALWDKHGYKSAMCKPFARAIEQAHGIGGK